ncbi:hypothetical protein VTJ49DRAFT_241 [Mycothermus thermophilus]|uniref:SRR1-like domain-containing protein n=1 Tax=Humicola insolens TaxID=85995 RepID=A0ABR3VH53_HUMIN
MFSRSVFNDYSSEVFDVCYRDRIEDPPMTRDEEVEKRAAAHALVQSKYDTGVPFFTKDVFRDLARQFEANGGPDGKISVTGLDGVTVHIPLKTGQEYPRRPYGDDFVCIVAKPIVHYRGIQNLLDKRPIPAGGDVPFYMNSIREIYLPVDVSHLVEVRDAQTKELVSVLPVADHDTVKQRLDQMRQSLEASEHFAQIRSTLVSVALPSGIAKIVALACSTMTERDPPECSLAQHALVLMLRDFLSRDSSKSGTGSGGPGSTRIQCFAQEPRYLPIDEQVLRENGVTVLDDPGAFVEIDETSVVLSIAPDIPVREIVADIARPAIMIWDKVVVKDKSTLWTDPVTPRVERMMEDYIELPFPPNDELFGDVAIYVRKGDSKVNRPGQAQQVVGEQRLGVSVDAHVEGQHGSGKL